MVQPTEAPISTTLTLAAPQRTVAARAVGWSLLRIRLTMRVTSMIGLAGWSHPPCLGSAAGPLKRPPPLGTTTVVAGRFTVHFHAGAGAATSGGCALPWNGASREAGVR